MKKFIVKENSSCIFEKNTEAFLVEDYCNPPNFLAGLFSGTYITGEKDMEYYNLPSNTEIN